MMRPTTDVAETASSKRKYESLAVIFEAYDRKELSVGRSSNMPPRPTSDKPCLFVEMEFVERIVKMCIA